MEVICIEDEAFYSLIEEVVQRLKKKNNIKEDKWLSALGHRDIKMTSVYLRQLPTDELRAEVESISIDNLI